MLDFKENEVNKVRQKKPRLQNVKKTIQGMMPVKKWLTVDEACSFLNMSQTHFRDFVSVNSLTVAELKVLREKGRKYYRVTELEEVFEKSILIKKVN